LRIFTRHKTLRAASHRAIGYIDNQHEINAMKRICLNSFRIKSAQSNRPIGVNKIRAEKHRVVIFAIEHLSCHYTPWAVKKGATFIFTITLANVDRFQ